MVGKKEYRKILEREGKSYPWILRRFSISSSSLSEKQNAAFKNCPGERSLT